MFDLVANCRSLRMAEMNDATTSHRELRLGSGGSPGSLVCDEITIGTIGGISDDAGSVAESDTWVTIAGVEDTDVACTASEVNGACQDSMS